MQNKPVVFIGMETSGALRARFQAKGFFTVSCDILPPEDGAMYDSAGLGGHIQGDVFETLEFLLVTSLWPTLAIFHIPCTYATNAAAWALSDPDYDRYPTVGYHQKAGPGTLLGQERRDALDASLDQFRRVAFLKIRRKIVENPVGALSKLRSPSQIVQPYQFGDDASKATCFWYFDEMGGRAPELAIPDDPSKYVEPTLRKNGKRYWANQTDTGQNKLSPAVDRWKDRSRTFPGIADAAVNHWSNFV